MPKGVEHLVLWLIVAYLTNVPDSVMPKGVEHLTKEEKRLVYEVCAGFSDAERR